jgi:biopolymer transport protein ExbD
MSGGEHKGREVKHNMREGKSNAQARKIKKYNEKSDESSHVDLAPMVDIAFLLLTFFMLTTSFAKPNVFQMGLPEKNDGSGKSTPVNPKFVMTIQVSKKGTVFMNRGLEGPNNEPQKVKFEEVKKQVANYRKAVLDDPENTRKSDIITVVKIDRNTDYNTMIETLNEIFDGGVAKWATVELKKEESEKLDALEKK